MSNIFVSYRRAETADVAGRIYDRLVARFGAKHVFMDVDAIPAGVDFRRHIEQTLENTDALVVVIGREWATVSHGGRHRLDQPDDPVRVELELAHNLGIPIFPLLVQGASMPTKHQVPDSLAWLIDLNGLPVRPNPDFLRDMNKVISSIRQFRLTSPGSIPAQATAAFGWNSHIATINLRTLVMFPLLAVISTMLIANLFLPPSPDEHAAESLVEQVKLGQRLTLSLGLLGMVIATAGLMTTLVRRAPQPRQALRAGIALVTFVALPLASEIARLLTIVDIAPQRWLGLTTARNPLIAIFSAASVAVATAALVMLARRAPQPRQALCGGIGLLTFFALPILYDLLYPGVDLTPELNSVIIVLGAFASLVCLVITVAFIVRSVQLHQWLWFRRLVASVLGPFMSLLILLLGTMIALSLSPQTAAAILDKGVPTFVDIIIVLDVFVWPATVFFYGLLAPLDSARLPIDGKQGRVANPFVPGRMMRPPEAVIALFIMLGILLLVISGILRAADLSAVSIPRFQVLVINQINGPSMQPTLHAGQHVLIASYARRLPKRGDIVAYSIGPELTFPNSGSELQTTSIFIQRIIAVPGDHISVISTKVTLNGRALHEPYVASSPHDSSYVDPYPPVSVTLPSGEYFVLGDNRWNSADSRVFGPVPLRMLLGNVVAIFGP